jgi:hypothetical protein
MTVVVFLATALVGGCGGGGDSAHDRTGPARGESAVGSSEYPVPDVGDDPDEELAASLRGVIPPDLVPQEHGSFGWDEPELLQSDHPDFSHFIRVRYPAGSASQTVMRDDDAPSGGAQAYLAYARGPADAMMLRYYVRFPTGFDFVKGGKLPGLYGGTVTSGQNIPDGTDGFSTRFMWRAGGAAEVYAYLPSSIEHGTSIGRGLWKWDTGRWIRVEQKVRLNHPDRADGEVVVWIDGRLVLDMAGLRYRTVDTLKIDGVFFSTFFGGDDTSWSTPTDQYADFGGISIRAVAE